MKQETVNFSLKDQLFNEKKVRYLAELLSTVYSDFQKKEWIFEVLEGFPRLELMQRIHHIAQILAKYLPHEKNGNIILEKAFEIIRASLPEVYDNGKMDNDFGDFIFAPYGFFVAKEGLVYLQTQTVDGESVSAGLVLCFSMLEEITQKLSSISLESKK